MSPVAQSRIVFLAIAATVLGLSSLAASATVEDGCYEDWSDAAPVVARERLMLARDVHAMTRRERAGDVVRLTLCRTGSAFIYRMVLRDERGRLSNRVIDARAP